MSTQNAATKWCWLRHPSSMHDGLRLIDMLWPLVLMPPFLMFRGSAWSLLWFPVGVIAVVLSKKHIPSCNAHNTNTGADGL